MKMKLGLALVWLALAVSAYPAGTAPEAGPRNQALHDAIRSGNNTRLKQMLDAGADPNSIDARSTPALMNAVLYMNADAVRSLVRRGANVNARNAAGATALIWAAGDPEKARILLDAGADVSVQSGPGRTALHNAAMAPGGAVIVKALLAKGAPVDAKDKIDGIPVIPTGGGRGTPLIDAARIGDLTSIQMLLDKGADVNATDSHNGSALSEAILYTRHDLVKLLLAKGASVQATVTPLKTPLLTLAAMRRDAAMIKMLVAAGAPVNVADVTGATPLMWAAYGDANNEDAVAALLEAKADPMARNKAGESALDWALARGETAVAAMLRKAGSPQKTLTRAQIPSPEGPVSLEKTFQLLLPPQAAKMTGCATCHNHTLPVVAASYATRKGIPVNAAVSEAIVKQIQAMVVPATEPLAEGTDAFPDVSISAGYILEALAAQKVPASDTTVALVHNIMMKQAADGRWVGWAPRPPLEAGDLQATALSIRSLTLYPIPGRSAEINARVRRAAAWLAKAQPATTEDRIMRLLGLHWAGAESSLVRESARQLAALQQSNGGWSQLPKLPTDAYATGKAVFALAQVRGGAVDSSLVQPAIARGAQYLQNSQLPDGSWHVTTRAFPFQPLKDSGFPHGRDQWISAAATSWAAIALIDAEGAPAQAKRTRKPRRSAD